MAGRQTSLRRSVAGFALAAAGILSAATPAQASDFTQTECGTIVGIATKVAGTIGPQKLSPEFKRSMVAFVSPPGRPGSCTGPKDISTPSVEDVAAFNTMQDFLEAGTHPINLKKAGLRSVDPKALSAARPAAIKRSDAGSVPKS